MARSRNSEATRVASKQDQFARLKGKDLEHTMEKQRSAHVSFVLGNQHRCKTDTAGFATPQNRSPLDLVLDATEGFIPLWGKGVTLRWRFQAQSFVQFAKPEVVKVAVRKQLARALQLWGGSAPVRFSEKQDVWDFEVVVQESDDCNHTGCVLAQAFFPDAGRHELLIFPKMLDLPPQEQIETLAHELGHVFGLRHFFAQLSETAWPSVRFGEHKPFSIMNYGEESVMTDSDRSDLKILYEKVWSGELRQINGTPIKLFRPYHQS